MSSFFDKILSKYQCGICKGFNTQLIDLSKAFDCPEHELSIVKPNPFHTKVPLNQKQSLMEVL